MKILIVGSNGFLGAALSTACTAAKIPAVQASHSGNPDLVLDLNSALDSFISKLPSDTSHAVICSAITNIDRCFERSKETAFFNVQQTSALIQVLVRKGITPVFCSTDLVFRGDRGAYSEYDERLPTTEYGRQKVAVENFIASTNSHHLIVRFSKLYSTATTDTSPILQTINKLRRNEHVLAAIDSIICPTNVEDAAQGIVKLILRSANGAFHISPQPQGWYSRYTLAMTLASHLGCEKLVDQCLLADIPAKDPRPRNNSLLSNRLFECTRWRPRLLSSDLDALLPH